MTPAARVQAAIDLLDLIIVSARDNGSAADRIIADWFKQRRYAGSGDRRAVRELVYQAVRAFGERPSSGRAAMVGLARSGDPVGALFDASPYGPPLIAETEAGAAGAALPPWLAERIPEPEWEALGARAPLDIRVNTLKTSVLEMRAAFPSAECVVPVPDALRLRDPITIANHPAFEDGLVDVQDAGSQMVALACQAKPGLTVIDLCAGAGGKTLALAAAMAGEGRLIAADTDRRRLAELPPRAHRAGVDVECLLLDAGHEARSLAPFAEIADIVLVDAPCSGTGTLRRNPEIRWRLTPERLGRLVKVQAMLLRLAASLVRPGGCMTYAVCSLLDEEGADQIAAFLKGTRAWRADPVPLSVGRIRGAGMMLTPAHDDVDGFFVARLVRTC